jgi:hypothetical protein
MATATFRGTGAGPAFGLRPAKLIDGTIAATFSLYEFRFDAKDRQPVLSEIAQALCPYALASHATPPRVRLATGGGSGSDGSPRDPQVRAARRTRRIRDVPRVRWQSLTGFARSCGLPRVRYR